MQQKIMILIFNLMVLTCYLVSSENIPPVPKTNRKNDTNQQFSEYWDPSDCGRRAILNDIASNETETTVLKWPWVASIYFVDPSEKNPKYCGTASIITEKHLITAAQVFAARNASEEIRLSDYFAVVSGEFGEEGLIYNIQNIHTSSVNGKEQALLGGIAIVQLVNALTLTDSVRPICLPRMEDKNNNHQNQTLTAVGWIHLSDNFSDIVALCEVDVPILPEEYCQQYIPGTYPTEKLICGLDLEESTSHISNGAPLMTSIYDQWNKDNKFTLIGITDRNISRDPFSGNPDKPTYFMKVAADIDWITKIIQNSRE